MTEWAAKVLDAPERVMVSWSAKGRAVVSGPISAGVIHTIGATAYIRADLAALTEQNQTWQRNSRETFDAMVAMRNSINEHLPMPSLESDLLQGPENSVFCAAVADAVVQHVAALTAKRDEYADQISTLFPAVNREAVEQRARAEAAEAQIATMIEADAVQAMLDAAQPIMAEACRGYEEQIAALTAQVAEMRASISWVDEVYPERIEAGGAGLQITWEEFNAMQAAIGVTIDKRIGGAEGKAVHNHRLRTKLKAAEAERDALRAKVARLEEKAVLWIEQGMVIVAPESVPQRRALESYRKQFAALVRAALTDGAADE